MITDVSYYKITDKLFHFTCTESFLNNQNVNTSIIDTLENHIIDFSKSSNIKIDTNEYSIKLNNTSNDGYFITKDILPHNATSTINNFYMLANYSTETNEYGDTKPTITFFIVTDKGEEFEINHKTYLSLVLLKSPKSFRLKCKMKPSSSKISPVVFGYSIHYKDSTIFDINTNNIRK